MRDSIRMLITATAVLFAALVSPGQAAATTLDQFFNKMTNDEENAYILTMTKAVEKVLSDAGQPELVRQVEALFADGEKSEGSLEFNKAVNAFQEQEMVRETTGEESQDGPLLIEEMMVRELQHHQIVVPPSFMAAAKAGNLNEMAAEQGSPPAAPVTSNPGPSDDDPIGAGGFISSPKN